MHRRGEGWRFGDSCDDPFFERHEEVVDGWLSELEAAGDTRWQSAEHAAYCWVSYRTMLAGSHQEEPNWDDLMVGDFLFGDLSEGGTVLDFGPAEQFFDHVCESFRRFVDAGIIDVHKGRGWLADVLAAKEDFVRFYDGDTSDADASAIRRRRTPHDGLWG